MANVIERSQVTPPILNKYQESLLNWHAWSARRFPWRTHIGDPYPILVAELMLRKTTARQVAEVYPRFIAVYPSPERLARAHIDRLRRMLHPLGLSTRATLLKALGKSLVADHAGRVP